MSLIVKPINAELVKGNDMIFFKKSPYAVCQVGNEIMKTNPDKNGGKTPKWPQSFTFTQLGPKLRVTLMAKHTISKEEVLGQGQFDLTPAYNNPYVSDKRDIQVTKNGVVVARVLCFIEYRGTAINNSNLRNQLPTNMPNMIPNQFQNMNQPNNMVFNSGISNMSNNGSMVREVNVNTSSLSNNNNNSGVRYTVRSQSPSVIDYKTYMAPQPVIQTNNVPVPVFILNQPPVTVPISSTNNISQLSKSQVGMQPYPIRQGRMPLSSISGTPVINSARTVYLTPQKAQIPIVYQIRQNSPAPYQVRQKSLTKSPSFGPEN